MQLGAAFHYLIHQHALGIPVEILDKTADQDVLCRWWKAYRDTPPSNLPTTFYRTEVRLSMPLGSLLDSGPPTPRRTYRLTARYDLLAIEPGQRAVIVDWKTGAKRPKRKWLAERWQTLVYRYVLVHAGAHLNGNAPIQPEQIEMIYWFADFPAQPERFRYDTEQNTATEHALAQLISKIELQSEREWPLTNDERHCRYCVYRTLCDRTGDQEGDTGEESEDDPFDFDLDLEQIAEIAF
jgi:hypothetical protein